MFVRFSICGRFFSTSSVVKYQHVRRAIAGIDPSGHIGEQTPGAKHTTVICTTTTNSFRNRDNRSERFVRWVSFVVDSLWLTRSRLSSLPTCSMVSLILIPCVSFWFFLVTCCLVFLWVFFSLCVSLVGVCGVSEFGSVQCYCPCARCS